MILGGGFCGTLVAKKLEKQKYLATVLIDRKSYFEYSPKIHKIPLNFSYAIKERRTFSKILQNTEIIIDEIMNVTPQTVETKQNRINFDFLVITTGINYPIRLENTTAVFTLKSSNEAIQLGSNLVKAEQVIIIGGGLIGVEITAQLATKTKNKQLTLVHSKKRLLERLPIKASKYAEKFLRSHDVRIILGERIIDYHENQFTSKSGQVINADLGIWAAGIEWNPTFMQDFPSSIRSSRGALKVNPFLQLMGYSNIFVGGDVTDIAEEKTAQHAERHANLISRNLMRMVKSKSLIPYSIQSRPIAISLGDWNGILSYKNLVITGLIPAVGKELVDWWTYRRYS